MKRKVGGYIDHESGGREVAEVGIDLLLSKKYVVFREGQIGTKRRSQNLIFEGARRVVWVRTSIYRLQDAGIVGFG